MMNNNPQMEEIRTELLQASAELDEAASIIEGKGLPQVASLFKIAAHRKRQLATKLFPSLVATDQTPNARNQTNS